MRKLILLFSFLLLISINIFSQHPRIDVSYGIATNSSDFAGGMYMKNIKNGFGFYFNTYGFGAYTGDIGVDYGRICDRTEIDRRGIIKENSHGGLIGLTYNPVLSEENKKNRLNLIVGLGYAVKEEVSQTYYYYIWDCCPNLNEGRLVTYISDTKIIPSIEALIGYDIIKTSGFIVGLEGGFATTHGFIGQIYVGIEIF